MVDKDKQTSRAEKRAAALRENLKKRKGVKKAAATKDKKDKD